MLASRILPLCLALATFLPSCSDDADAAGVARVRIKNDFANPAISGFQPPWTLCHVSYRGVSWRKVEIDQVSDEKEVPAGLDYVLMVAAWDDPTCDPAHCLPIATKVKEEVVSGQSRTIAVGMTNHQGPCPPEGVPPIPEEQYDRIRDLWPEYAFEPYADRASNAQCGGGDTDAGADAEAEGGTEGGT